MGVVRRVCVSVRQGGLYWNGYSWGNMGVGEVRWLRNGCSWGNIGVGVGYFFIISTKHQLIYISLLKKQ